jgi:hypothetical protein
MSGMSDRNGHVGSILVSHSAKLEGLPDLLCRWQAAFDIVEYCSAEATPLAAGLSRDLQLGGIGETG